MYDNFRQVFVKGEIWYIFCSLYEYQNSSTGGTGRAGTGRIKVSKRDMLVLVEVFLNF